MPAQSIGSPNSCNVARKSGRTAKHKSPLKEMHSGAASPNSNKTKNNRPRSANRKPTITEHRLRLRDAIWAQARQKIKAYVDEKKGNARALALALGISPSQVHRYLCDKCEHDQEPSFTIGTAMLLFIQSQTRITDV